MGSASGPGRACWKVAKLVCLVVAGIGAGAAYLTGEGAEEALVTAIAVSGIVGYTANLGGQIGHPEIRTAQSAASREVGSALDDD